MRRMLLALAFTLSGASMAQAQGVPVVKEILMRSVAVPTVEGRGKVPELAEYYAGVLKSAGYAAGDLAFVPMGETGYFTATLRGKRSDKPTILLGHMDVVEAKAADWERDPFVPVEENGYIFGRGAEDNKYDVAMMVATMARLKQEKFRPAQDIVLVLTGDEETQMATTRAAAQAYRHAGLVLNGDAGGTLIEEDGRPGMVFLQAGEKSYVDFTVTMTDPGGHSSAPTATNPIYRMARALARLDAFRFPAMQNELTRAVLAARVPVEAPETRAAIEAFLADPSDTAAADLLSARPELIGQIRTTCIATMIEGGHAPNALPQKARANVNCRVFPGVAIETIHKTLVDVLAEPAMEVTVSEDATASDASPLRPDVMKALKAAAGRRFPGVPVVPVMSAGATDSLHFRALGIPSYGVGSLAMRTSDSFAHGLNERVPVAGMESALVYWHDLLTALTK
ncbi:putative M20A family peptidase [Sphingobium sp. SYK-6]|uniref:M20/M25/M40 family metallo-hydrolase n=1 Tax=Sphingobium sp. (strain NBRC 103272 / SYK-6) TaxID=627192 RepID=UPI0002276F6B|nr:M20/M25/M40 family metallo-hydrolase [Sphingobium sp. SYK-6]BAK66279.1 putative M20A family peptidase [Sphingobium sp. SYK-6]